MARKKANLLSFSYLTVILLLFLGMVGGYIVGVKNKNIFPFPASIQDVSSDKKVRVSPASEAYFVKLSEYQISIRKDVFVEDKNGQVKK